MTDSVKLDSDSFIGAYARQVALSGAEMIADKVSMHTFQGFTLLIEASCQPLFTVSPKGLAAYLRAHADIIDNPGGPKRERAYRDLQRALRRIGSDATAYVEAMGRRVS